VKKVSSCEATTSLWRQSSSPGCEIGFELTEGVLGGRAPRCLIAVR